LPARLIQELQYRTNPLSSSNVSPSSEWKKVLLSRQNSTTTEAVSGVVDLNRAARMRHRPGKVDVEVDGTILAEIEQ